ncbi:hypothetical protein COO60DRAFT_1476660 [Scenedesmus sp. NREL 46B-D3]|nr:hypothetical protein COO60DRAFT_1476660 [Scenedesmus sp. NREL 46B-D3]
MYKPCFGLAAAQQLGADVVEGMLQHVLRQCDAQGLKSVCGLAGAAQISREGVTALFRQALGYAANHYLYGNVAECVTHLSCLLGARQLDAAAVCALLTDAVMAQDSVVVAALCSLPAAASVSAGMLQELKQLAARNADAGTFEALSRLQI